MKPFNLEAAKAGAKVITRYGHPVRILCFDRLSEFPIVAAVMDKQYEEAIHAFALNGNRFYANSAYDLCMATSKKGAWLNVYPEHFAGKRYETKIMADGSAGKDRIDCIYVEWEE